MLLDKMMQEAKCGDLGLVDAIMKGTMLTGVAEVSGILLPRMASPQISEAELSRSTKWTRHAVLGKMGSKDPKVDQQLWDEAMIECEKGWLEGPLSEEQLNRRRGRTGWVANPRFALKQGDKLRSIDDFSASFTNSAFASCEKPTLPGVDEISGMLKLLSSILAQTSDHVALSLSDGTRLSGTQHRVFKLEAAKVIQGRTLDLENAYRQLAVAEGSKWTSVVSIFCPQSRTDKVHVQCFHAQSCKSRFADNSIENILFDSRIFL